MSDARPCPECGAPLTSTGSACGDGIGSSWWECERCGHHETIVETWTPRFPGRRPGSYLASLTPEELAHLRQAFGLREDGEPLDERESAD